MRDYLIVMAVTIAATAAAVPPLRALSRRVGAMARPSDRSVHAKPTPLLGGAALFVGVLAGFVTAALLPGFRLVFEAPLNVVGVVVAAAVMFCTGLVDDIRDVSPPAKLAGMVLSGSVLTLVGITVIYFRVPFLGFTVLPPDLAALVSVVWVVILANAVNLIDGLDGLAAGIVAIASVAFFLYGWELLQAGVVDASNIGLLVAIITAGACIGFLPFNFNPASIFMGDSGALMLGLLLASSTIAVGGSPMTHSPASRGSSSLRWSSRCSSSACRCSTRRSPSSGAPPGGPVWRPPTRRIFTTASWTSDTATAELSSSCGRGRRC